jgi:hypothetical protein
MPLSMIVWFAVGSLSFLAIRIRQGEVLGADIILALMLTVTGPFLPLLIGAWYFGIWLERLAQVTIWKRKGP